MYVLPSFKLDNVSCPFLPLSSSFIHCQNIAYVDAIKDFCDPFSQTGDFAVLDVDVVMDVGKSLNPAIDLGQIEGAFLQGQGGVTMEQQLYEPGTGRMLTNGPGE